MNNVLVQNAFIKWLTWPTKAIQKPKFSDTNGEYHRIKDNRQRFQHFFKNHICRCRNIFLPHQYLVPFTLQVQLKKSWSIRCYMHVYSSTETSLCCWICQDVACSFRINWIRLKWTQSWVWLYHSINLQETVVRNRNMILMFPPLLLL